MDFKTNAKCEDCVIAIKKAVQNKFPDAKLEFDLQNSDKILHVHGIPEESQYAIKIENAIQEAGFTGSWLTRGFENK